MGMFIGGTEDWGEPMTEEERKKWLEIYPKKSVTYSKTIPHVCEGDLICVCVTDMGDIIDEAYIKEIKDDKIMVTYLDNRDDGATVEWTDRIYLKICNAITEE